MIRCETVYRALPTTPLSEIVYVDLGDTMKT